MSCVCYLAGKRLIKKSVIQSILLLSSALLMTIPGTVHADSETAQLHADTLRVIYHAGKNSDEFLQFEKNYIQAFAREHNLKIHWHEIPESWQIINALLEGKGDLVIGENQSVTGGINSGLLFSLPVSIMDAQQVVTRSDTTRINRIEDLYTRQIALKKSSPAWSHMLAEAEKVSTMEIIEIPESENIETILRHIETGFYDITILNSVSLSQLLPEYPKIKPVFNLSEGYVRSWILPEGKEETLDQINQFLNMHHYALKPSGIYYDDLPLIQKRRHLRVITYPNAANYYVKDGKLFGFEYALLNQFADIHRLELDVIVAKSHEEMQTFLLEGKGDVIAASLPELSIDDPRISLSQPYNYIAPIIVGRDSDKLLMDVNDLAGRRVMLSSESPYTYLMDRIKQKGIGFEAVMDHYDMDIENTLLMVSLGMYDLTVLGSHQLTSDYVDKFNLKPVLTLKEPEPLRWAVRSENTQLLNAINNFIQQAYQQKKYNTLYSKYFGNKNILTDGSIETRDISPYDNIVRVLADKYGFDWRLIVAQMYQESHFDADAVSRAGAKGLMQIMPDTEDFLKMDTSTDPETNIHAGIKYMSILRDQFEHDLMLENKIWFSLASYNAGFNRIKQARELATDMGLDKDQWFGNVEKAMLVLAKPYQKDGETRRNCRCGETVVYVRAIRSLYNNYVQITRNTQLARATGQLADKQDI